MIKLCVLQFVLLIILIFRSTNNISAQDKTFTNPILAGFYPDPSICKVGNDYYIVNSTFAFFPGIPVFQSRDLVNWKLLGHVLDRPEQLNLDGLGVSRAIFAPAIRYDDGIFYVTCTLVDGGGNFIVKAVNPEGPWSNPVWLPEINGIDPSLFFDDDGKAYITYNSDAPDNKPLYDGHRTVRIVEFDIDNMKVLSEPEILVNGGVDISKKPIWIEGPHIYKIKGIYYLNAAEGGTAEDHSQVIFKSDKVNGPYIPYDKNPILTQRDLDPKRKFPVTCTGHADFIQTDEGSWWAIFLGCRPYKPFEKNFYNTGRETFLAPVKWIDGWPVINPDFEEVQYRYPLPIEPLSDKVDIPYSGNFTIKDDFDKDELHKSWIFLRTPHEKWYDLESKRGFLSINLRPETCSGKMNPSFIARRQQHSIGYGITSLEFVPNSENEKAGLVIFQDETHFYYLCKSKDGNNEIIQLYKSNTDSMTNNMELLTLQILDEDYDGKELILKIETVESEFNFYYGYDLNDLKLLKEKVDATYLKIKSGWAFTGNVYAIYATSLGSQSNNTAYFNWFEYAGDDEVYK
ncbi:MAG: xylan 1,4-beta-xylosidase [Ignavibacteria bacterium RBG_13_36_8]|nr:MAG: xylan 1,4-beta-xylosidase [Ignavibacteria bacterium RBG_13_36_8]